MRSLDIVIFKNSRRRDERIGVSSSEKLFSALAFAVVFMLLEELMNLSKLMHL